MQKYILKAPAHVTAVSIDGCEYKINRKKGSTFEALPEHVETLKQQGFELLSDLDESESNTVDEQSNDKEFI